ncbi:MAG: DUF5110 domain-containing protein [Anaerolineales bacterium]|nr:DUF5110 domain-containing protein [Anaerolineales bacterium]
MAANSSPPPLWPRRKATSGYRSGVWLPDGEWRDFFTGEAYAGGWTTVFGDLAAIPVFAKAGAIVPLGPMVGWGGVDNPTLLQMHLFAGADGYFELYEDDGDTIAYQSGSYALTPFTLTWNERELDFSIGPANGDLSVLPMQRTYEAVIHGVVEPAQIELTINGAAALAEVVRYDAETETLSVVLGAIAPTGACEVKLSNAGEALESRRDRRAEKVRTMLRSFKVDNQVKARIDAELPQLMAGEINLSRYALTGAQSEALAQVIGQR